MFQKFELRAIPLDSKWFRQRASHFLAGVGLELDPELEYLVGVYDSDDRLVGCGGLQGHTIKCLALSEELRGQNVASTLVSHLYSIARDAGAPFVTVFTKPENKEMFRSLGFHLIGEAPKAVMMQSSRKGLDDYVAHLRSLPRGRRNGVIVMNANPLTAGHLFLIRSAAAECDCLTVIPVADNPMTLYSYSTRRSILLKACSSLPNVTVAEGSEYAISASTFPSYFIKKKSDTSLTHITLDLNIFARHIAPALDASVRFVGSEPSDELTAFYNKCMHSILPESGVEVKEFSRLECDDVPVSASNVRRLTEEGRLDEALKIVAPDTVPYLLARAAASALRGELDLTPKPGLVDMLDSGSHSDMDHSLMAISIGVLEPWFARMASVASLSYSPDNREELMADLVEIGREAEQEMLEATAGVNTHRGAIFAMGLMVAASASILARGESLSPALLSAEMAALASFVERNDESHGAEVSRRYGRGGALDMALDGYAPLFAEWLPALRSYRRGGFDFPELRLLLLIISTLHDSNALYRAGEEMAAVSAAEAAELLDSFSIEGVEKLNRAFIQRNISHGGAADMLALTLFADSILPS
ncbi:MAG: GNAT family N-acetyltransferase [Bacteroidales bacterium]|nr:GNAT family N-acetyltransferase [Bacteroidales bacterium]